MVWGAHCWDHLSGLQGGLGDHDGDLLGSLLGSDVIAFDWSSEAELRLHFVHLCLTWR